MSSNVCLMCSLTVPEPPGLPGIASSKVLGPVLSLDWHMTVMILERFPFSLLLKFSFIPVVNKMWSQPLPSPISSPASPPKPSMHRLLPNLVCITVLSYNHYVQFMLPMCALVWGLHRSLGTPPVATSSNDPLPFPLGTRLN